MANPLRGEVWLVDLGMVAKIRPCLVFSVPAAGPNDRARHRRRHREGQSGDGAGGGKSSALQEGRCVAHQGC